MNRPSFPLQFTAKHFPAQKYFSSPDFISPNKIKPKANNKQLQPFTIDYKRLITE